MKNLVFSLFSLLAIFMLAFNTACDKVEPPYLTIPDVVEGDTVRKLLLEDFTGHKCPNCPGAHKTIEDLQHVYGDRIVVLVNHTGYFARTVTPYFEYDFTTTAGDAYSVFFGADQAGFPKGMVNRENNGSGYLLNPTAYGTAVSLVLDSMPVTPDIYIELEPSYSTSDSMISVDVKLTALTAMPAGKYNLSVLVTESNIVKPQDNSDPNMGATPIIHDYVHKDVLRGDINSPWGEEFADAAIANGEVFNKSYASFKIGKDWKPADLKILAFVYFADGPNDKVVIQAEEVKLIE